MHSSVYLCVIEELYHSFPPLASFLSIGAIFTNRDITAHTEKDDKAISQFQSLCTALAATIGTGNIVGVATAILSGGPGAIFWMWAMAILGMMTNYSENVLRQPHRPPDDAVDNSIHARNGL